MDLADSLGLVCSLPELSVPTHYSDTDGHANSVIDLILLGMSCAQVLHRIEPDLRQPSDHAPLILDLPISPENIRFSRKVLKCDSDEENNFLSSVTMGLHALNFFYSTKALTTVKAMGMLGNSSQSLLPLQK